MHYVSSLFIVESLEMIGLHSVRCQHRLLSGRVLSHHVMSQRVVQLVALLIRPVLLLFHLSIALLLGQL